MLILKKYNTYEKTEQINTGQESLITSQGRQELRTLNIVSIIVPAFNAAGYIDECVQSLLRQTYCNLQIILVDDGSTDATSEKCDTWVTKDSRIQVIHKRNAGLPAARNSGFALARGDWVMFVDSDDLLVSDAVEILLENSFIDRVDVVAFDLVPFNQSGDMSRKQIGLEPFPDSIISGRNYFMKQIYNANLGHYTWSYFYRREIIAKMSDGSGPFREEYKLYEDVVFMHLFMKNLEYVSYCPKILYRYRQSPNSMIRSINPIAAQSALEAVRLVYGIEIPEDLSSAKRSLCCGLLLGADAVAGGKSSKVRKEIRQEVLRIGFTQGVSEFKPVIRLKCWLMRLGLLGIVRAVIRGLRRARNFGSKKARP